MRFEGVSKHYPGRTGPKIILCDAAFDLPLRANVALLGPNGAGKSTILKLMAGTERPSAGRIRRFGRISWPLGFAGGFDRTMTGRENTVFVARLYGYEPAPIAAFVEDFAELGRAWDNPVQTYSAGMKQRLNFGLSMAFDFDCYLVDEVMAVGDSRFRERCRQIFEARRRDAGMVMVSHSVAMLREYCDSAAVILNGDVVTFESLEEGLAEFACLMRVLERV